MMIHPTYRVRVFDAFDDWTVYYLKAESENAAIEMARAQFEKEYGNPYGLEYQRAEADRVSA